MNKTIDGTTNGLSDRTLALRLIIFGVFTVVAAALAYAPLRDLLTYAKRSDYYSHILLIPLVTVYFLFEQRKTLPANSEFKPLYGAILGGIGAIVYLAACRFGAPLAPNDFASMTTAGCLVFWWGGFVVAFGVQAFRIARFGLLFMAFMIPFPEFLLDRLVYVLQAGSTEVTQWFFELTGTNYIRDGFVYQLTGINIEVAKECSSIRSSIALIITGVVAGHLFLRSGWNKLWLLIAMIPVNIIKNGIRIVTLSLLAIYVDRKFITDSFLHHSGGFLFYLPALGMMAAIVMRMRKGEAKQQKHAEKEEPDLPRMGDDERR